MSLDNATRFLLPILAVGINLAAIIIGIDCVWRVEKRLGEFLKIFVAGLIVLAIRMILGIGGFADSPHWSFLVWSTDIITGALFFSSLLLMYHIILSLKRKKSRRRR